jgi:hypothetical protein
MISVLLVASILQQGFSLFHNFDAIAPVVVFNGSIQFHNFHYWWVKDGNDKIIHDISYAARSMEVNHSRIAVTSPLREVVLDNDAIFFGWTSIIITSLMRFYHKCIVWKHMECFENIQMLQF